jgi:hypothetical protein
MSEPNPYESPRSEEPLTPAQVVKRGIGVATILLLTPVAMVIAVAGACTASMVFPGLPWMLIAVCFPLLLLVGLMVWAAVLDRARPGDANRAKSRLGVFLATPAVVAIAMAVGFGLALLVVSILSEAEGGFSARGMLIGTVLFWAVPGAALIGMLWLAWRGRYE